MKKLLKSALVENKHTFELDLMMPVQWGWQYVASELVMKDGSVVQGANDLIDKATGKT